MRDDRWLDATAELEVNIHRAHANMLRQRRREEAGLPTIVSSSFWERVELDYRKTRDRRRGVA